MSELVNRNVDQKPVTLNCLTAFWGRRKVWEGGKELVGSTGGKDVDHLGWGKVFWKGESVLEGGD